MNELLDRKEVLICKEVMAILRIGRNTFYRLIHEGKLKAYRDGNRYKVLSTSVNEYIEKSIN